MIAGRVKHGFDRTGNQTGVCVYQSLFMSQCGISVPIVADAFKPRPIGKPAGTKQRKGQSADQHKAQVKVFTGFQVSHPQQKEAAAIPRREARLLKAQERDVRSTLSDSRSPLWESARKAACPFVTLLYKKEHALYRCCGLSVAYQWPHAFCNILYHRLFFCV